MATTGTRFAVGKLAGIGAALLCAGALVSSAQAADTVVLCDLPTMQNASNSGWNYPKEVRKRGRDGAVTLRLQLDSSGLATDVAVVSSSGNRTLDRAALRSAQQGQFCKMDGTSLSSAGVADVRVVYRLDRSLMAGR